LAELKLFGGLWSLSLASVGALTYAEWSTLHITQMNAVEFPGAAFSPQATVSECNPPEAGGDPTAPQFRAVVCLS